VTKGVATGRERFRGAGPGEEAVARGQRILARRLRQAALAVKAERWTRRFWPLLAWLALALALGVAGWLPLLPAALHAAVLAALAAGGALLLARAARLVFPPLPMAARHRLEADVSGRAALALQDRLAFGDHNRFAAAAWQLHRRRVAAAARRLKPPAFAPGIAGQDPWAFRYMAGLSLFAALFLAGGDWERRLAESLRPNWTQTSAAAAP